MAASGAIVASGSLVSAAGAQTAPSSGNGAKRFDDLRELNNKLARSISRLEGDLAKHGSVIKDPGHWTRTLNDLEVTKLRAVDLFPEILDPSYGETFRQLSCIDSEIAVSKQIMILLEGPQVRPLLADHAWLTHRGNHYVSRVVLDAIKNAKACKETLEVELSGASMPTGISDDLRELNNKLARSISRLEGDLAKHGSVIKDPGHWTRTLNDLEVTKIRAVDQFPPVFGMPYGETFRQLSCIDSEIAVSKQIMILLEGPQVRPLLADHAWLTHRGNHYVSRVVLDAIENAKACKDTLEVELMHSFELKPSEQTEVGVNATTPNGTDTRNPNKLNAPETLEHAYAHDGFVGRHEQDYVANGVNSSSPDSWPSGRNVLFFDVFDLFGSTSGAQKAETASIQNLKSSGFTLISDSSLGPGEAAFQHQAAGSPLLSTIIYLQRGTFIMKIAGACNGCSKGSVESTLKSEAQAQLNRAVIMGYPAASSTASHIPEEFQTSGNAPVYAFGQPGYHLCLYLHGPAGQTGNVKVEPGDSTSQSDPNAQTYNQAFTLDSNGTAFFSFDEPAELFKITINRQEADGSTNTTTTSAETRIHNPPPWGLPDCT